jgi:hypothetical protein
MSLFNRLKPELVLFRDHVVSFQFTDWGDGFSYAKTRFTYTKTPVSDFLETAADNTFYIARLEERLGYVSAVFAVLVATGAAWSVAWLTSRWVPGSGLWIWLGSLTAAFIWLPRWLDRVPRHTIDDGRLKGVAQRLELLRGRLAEIRGSRPDPLVQWREIRLGTAVLQELRETMTASELRQFVQRLQSHLQDTDQGAQAPGENPVPKRPMTVTRALDEIVTALAGLDLRLSGDDSPLANPWEEIKEQLQNELSAYWPTYLETMRQFVSGFVAGLDEPDLAELKAALKASSTQNLERKVVQRLLARAKKEKIGYSAFDFEYFCYPLLDFTVYGQVTERTGSRRCLAHVFSVAAPTGEYGTVDCSRIDVVYLAGTLTFLNTCRLRRVLL